MRGVYTSRVACVRVRVGSSPHARGLRPARIVTADTYRIIPACAGFTPGRARPRSYRADHPRMRGVYAAPTTSDQWDEGSSPHARGLPMNNNSGDNQHGIIPACAGFTTPAPGVTRGPPDHPRMRGVYTPRPSRARAIAGSSPHARGLRSVKWGASHSRRIIPACAGFTSGGPTS